MNTFQRYVAEEYAEDYWEGRIARRDALKVIAARNRFFGEEVTVAGLLAGGDVLAARERIEGRFLIIPEQACLKSGHIFLDDMTIESLERELGVPVSHGGGSFRSMLENAVRLESSDSWRTEKARSSLSR